MATLVAIAYPDEGTAEAARTTVWQLEEDRTIQAEQVAVISRDQQGRYHVHTSHSGFSMAGGAIWGGFWGFLFGALFLIPFAGWAVGAGMGGLFGHFKDKAIDETFQQRVREYLQPGTSALFLVIDHATPDEAIAGLQRYGGVVVRSSVSDEHTRRLQDALRPPAVTAADP